MRRPTIGAWLWIVAVAWLPASAGAQPLPDVEWPMECRLDGEGAPLECESKLRELAGIDTVESGTEQVVARAGVAETKALVGKPTAGAESSEASSNVEDLARLAAELGLGRYGSDGDDLVFEWMPEVFESLPGSRAKLTSKVRKPEPFAALLEQYPEEQRASRRDAFEEDLDDVDDIEWSFVVLAHNDRFGRNLGTHRQAISRVYDQLAEEAKSRQMGELMDTAGAAWTALLSESLGAGLGESSWGQIHAALVASRLGKQPAAAGVEPEAHRTAVESAVWADLHAARRAILDVVRGFAEYVDDRDALFDDLGFAHFADLVNNQPKLNLSLSARSRGRLAGPDTFSGELTWELASRNMNSLRRHCAREIDLGCLRSYFETLGEGSEGALAEQLARSWRLALSASYSQTERYRFADAEAGVDFSLAPVETLKGSLTAGGNFLRQVDVGDGRERQLARGRFDLEVAYERSTGDPAKETNRLVAVATVSHAIGEATDESSNRPAASFSIVYANKPEYRGVVDKELSARLGLKYKFDPGDLQGAGRKAPD